MPTGRILILWLNESHNLNLKQDRGEDQDTPIEISQAAIRILSLH